MKAGEEFKCPKCRKNSFLKKVSVLDGWTKKGEFLACASCSAKIADISDKNKEKAEKKALDKFAEFLKEEKNNKPQIVSDEGEKKFCKDCIHFIKHPFNDKCGLHNKFINPMDDCDDFRKKTN